MQVDSSFSNCDYYNRLRECYAPVRMRILAMFSVGCACLLASGDDVKVDNNSVRIMEIAYAPHATRTVPPQEANEVVISLDTGNTRRTRAAGRESRRHWSPGQAMWIPAGEDHVDKNVGSASLRFIEVELKNHAQAKPAERSPVLDPVVIDPKHNVLLLENEQVRVFRSWREPGAAEKMHEHTGAGRAAVLLTDLNATIKVTDGSMSALRASSGDVLWSGPVTHATTNLASKKFDMVVVEVK